jgi:hypothetical protein
MNCHLKTKTHQLTKKIELEKLYEDIKRKEKSGEIRILDEEQLRGDLKQLGLKRIVDHHKDLLTKQQKEKIKEFRNNNEVIIRKADKK